MGKTVTIRTLQRPEDPDPEKGGYRKGNRTEGTCQARWWLKGHPGMAVVPGTG